MTDGLLFFGFPLIFFSLEAIFYASTRRRFAFPVRILPELLTLFIYPLFFIMFCVSSFHPFLLASSGSVIILCIMAYFASYSEEPFGRITGLITKSLLTTGIIINVAIACYLVMISNDGWIMAVLGNLPIILAFVLAFLRNQRITDEDREVFGE